MTARTEGPHTTRLKQRKTVHSMHPSSQRKRKLNRDLGGAEPSDFWYPMFFVDIG